LNCKYNPDAICRHNLSCIDGFLQKKDCVEKCDIYSLYQDTQTLKLLLKSNGFPKSTFTSKFEDYNQGIYSVRNDRIEGVEIDLKILSEDKTYLLSEESELVLADPQLAFRVGIYLFRKACSLLTTEAAAKHQIQFAEINVSVFVCMQREFLNEVKWILKEYHIRPGAVILRILEDEAMESQAELKHMMDVMVDAGVTFSLGNYGTGYSNISYVYELPFSRIEITKDVFATALVDERARKVLKNSIDMLNELQIDIVISGADTDQAKRLAMEMGCSYIKGNVIPSINVDF